MDRIRERCRHGLFPLPRVPGRDPIQMIVQACAACPPTASSRLRRKPRRRHDAHADRLETGKITAILRWTLAAPSPYEPVESGDRSYALHISAPGYKSLVLTVHMTRRLSSCHVGRRRSPTSHLPPNRSSAAPSSTMPPGVPLVRGGGTILSEAGRPSKEAVKYPARLSNYGLSESPRVSRRLRQLRGWSHGKTKQVPRRGA